MKKIYDSPVKILAVMSLVLFVAFWALWFFCYRFYMIWLEGYSCFSSLPDFRSLYRGIPDGFCGYIGSFLHQFYSIPAVGAAIQAFFDVWPAVCVGVMIIRLFREPQRFLWISLLPLPFFAYFQFWDLHLILAVRCFIVSGILMAVVLALTAIKRPQWKIPGWLGNRYLSLALSVISVAASVYFLTVFDSRNRQHEEYAHLEYLGERHQWDDILELVSTTDARSDGFKRRYVLLALSEKGLLADYAFRYGLSGSEDFIFRDAIEPMALKFNVLFYECLGMHNAAIHQAYQLGVQSVTGMGFSSLRSLADIYIDVKDYGLAKKYIDILAHSCCNRKWVKERMSRLEEIRNAEPDYGQESYSATISNFTHTISSMVDRNRDDHKYSDLMLCGLLADEEGEMFKNIFRYVAQVQYPSGTGLPRLYEEALILIAMTEPSVLEGFTLSDDTVSRFNDYVSMMNARKGNQALRKHADTYWAYSY